MLKFKTSPSTCEDTQGQKGMSWRVQLGRVVALTPKGAGGGGGTAQPVPEPEDEKEATGRKQLARVVQGSKGVDPTTPHTAWGSTGPSARDSASHSSPGRCAGLLQQSVLTP